MSGPNIFLLSWDNTGIEAVINISAKEAEISWDILANKNSTFKIGSVVQHLMLRAKFNPQRHYEIYTLQVEPGITEEDIREMFETNPQYSADLVRDRGNKVYSDRARTSEVKIV
jgi:hypothetical protein